MERYTGTPTPGMPSSIELPSVEESWVVDQKGNVSAQDSKQKIPGSKRLAKIFSVIVQKTDKATVQSYQDVKGLVDGKAKVQQKYAQYHTKNGPIKRWIQSKLHGSASRKRDEVVDTTYVKLRQVFYPNGVDLSIDMRDTNVDALQQQERETIDRTYEILTSSNPTKSELAELDSMILRSQPGPEGADDNTQLAHWYSGMADRGFPVAKLVMAEYTENGIGGVDKSADHALSLYKEAADAGVKPAQARLMHAYDKGELGVEKNQMEAHKYAAKAQFVDDSSFLRLCMNQRTGLEDATSPVLEDRASARAGFKNLLNHESVAPEIRAEAAYQLAQMAYEDNAFDDADHYLLQALDLGHPDAGAALVIRARDKTPEAFNILPRAEANSEQTEEHLDHYDLAYMYQTGIMVGRSDDKALQHMKDAADIAGGAQSGALEAKITLAMMLEGQAGQEGLVRAAFEQIMERDPDNQQVAQKLAEYSEKGIGGDVDLKQAVKMYRKSGQEDRLLLMQGKVAESEGKPNSAGVFYKRAIQEGCSDAATPLLMLVATDKFLTSKYKDEELQEWLMTGGAEFVETLDPSELSAEQAAKVVQAVGEWFPTGSLLLNTHGKEKEVSADSLGEAFYRLDPAIQIPILKMVDLAKTAYPDDPQGADAIALLSQSLFGESPTAKEIGIAETLLEGVRKPWTGPTRPDLKVRWIVMQAGIEELKERKALTEEGIFRTAGKEAPSKEVDLAVVNFDYEQIESESEKLQEMVRNADLTNPTVANLIKRELRSLEDNLFPTTCYDEIIRLGDLALEDEEKAVEGLKNLIAGLPGDNREMLKYLCLFLKEEVVVHSGENLMTASNLSIVFMPSLVNPPKDQDPIAALTDIKNLGPFGALMIEKADEIFA